MSNPHDSPSDAFSPLIHDSPLTDHQLLSPADDSSPTTDSSALMMKQSENRQSDLNNQPQSILKKKGSFDSKILLTKKQLQQQQQQHQQQQQQFSIHPILKRNSAGPEMALSMPNTTTGSQVHPILKKSSSEDRTWWREEPLRTDPSSPSQSAAATPRPILKKRSSADEVVRVSGEIRPILKRKDSPKSDPPEFTPKPIIKSLSRNGSDESNSSPTGHTTRVMIQEPEFDSDHHEADDNTFTGPFMARVMQPRRKSHPVSSDDLRVLNHPLLNGKRSPLPFCSSESESQSQRPVAQNSPHSHHSHFHDHHFAPRRSPPLLKSLPNSPSSFETADGISVSYAFVDELEKFEKLSLLNHNSEHKSSSRNGNHIVDPHLTNNDSHPQPPDSQ
jgi:hypothetical protein